MQEGTVERQAPPVVQAPPLRLPVAPPVEAEPAPAPSPAPSVAETRTEAVAQAAEREPESSGPFSFLVRAELNSLKTFLAHHKRKSCTAVSASMSAVTGGWLKVICQTAGLGWLVSLVKRKRLQSDGDPVSARPCFNAGVRR